MVTFKKTILLSATAFVAMGSHTAMAADLSPAIIEAPMPMQSYEPAAPVAVGGWYIRGDVGYSQNELRGAHYFQGSNALVNDFDEAELEDSWLIGGGIGYNINSYLRTDLTLDFTKADFLGSTSGFDSRGLPVSTVDTTSMSALLLLANAYVDLGTYNGFTPYVGAGIGGAHVKWENLNNTIPTTSVDAGTTVHDGAESWRFAYALTAGASYCVTDAIEADANYRYTRIQGGDMFGYKLNGGPGYDKGTNLHQVRVGARYSFNGSSRCGTKQAAHVPFQDYNPVYK